ncbi:hypothetical protein GCM10027449_00590 [Sinomonas notoginsengisoli]
MLPDSDLGWSLQRNYCFWFLSAQHHPIGALDAWICDMYVHLPPGHPETIVLSDAPSRMGLVMGTGKGCPEVRRCPAPAKVRCG